MITTNLPLTAIPVQAFTRATTASYHSTAPYTSFSLELNQQCEGNVTEYIHSTELNTDSPHNTILGRLNYGDELNDSRAVRAADGRVSEVTQLKSILQSRAATPTDISCA